PICLSLALQSLDLSAAERAGLAALATGVGAAGGIAAAEEDRLIDRLEALGLVQRCMDPKDRRIWRLRLTPAAAPLLGEIKEMRAKLHAVMTKGIDPSVLDTMGVGLRQMKENVSSQRLAEAAA
ncbi:MAG: winged helix DNA-binding protein, partial [Xanthobacteraceae bacterium]|nr:winged helix DNA-binding protein [Xanthobacteraceae bacterium]